MADNKAINAFKAQATCDHTLSGGGRGGGGGGRGGGQLPPGAGTREAPAKANK